MKLQSTQAQNLSHNILNLELGVAYTHITYMTQI